MKVSEVSKSHRAAGPASPADLRTASELVDAFAATIAEDPGRAALRERAIEAWLPLAQRLARRFLGHGEPRDDLVQVAVVGLIKAVDRYDPEQGADFAAFAIPTVVGELRRYFRDHTWSVRVPRRLQELRLAIVAAKSTLTPALGRSPTVADIATYLGVSEEDVLEGLEGIRAYQASSLSLPVDDDRSVELGDTLGGEDEGFELVELRVMLHLAVKDLDERDRTIVSLRFYGDLTQAEIAEHVGVSQMHVSRLLTRALADLRRALIGECALTGEAEEAPRRRTRRPARDAEAGSIRATT